MFRFSAQVSRDPNGYRWVNLGGMAPEDGEYYPTSIFLQAQGHDEWMQQYRENGLYPLPSDHYDPFIQEPALFRIFARLDQSETAILDFANRYGDIAGIQDIVEEDGLTLGQWSEGIQEMKEAVAFADEIFTKPRKLDRGAKRGAPPPVDFMNEILCTVPVYLQVSEKGGRTSLDANAATLLDVMKLQLVTSIIERKKYRTCEHCTKPFEVTPQVNRSDRMFCSDSCRVKSYYRRKKQAIKMREGGQHLREIVKKTGSDLATVKGWLRDVQPKETKGNGKKKTRSR